MVDLILRPESVLGVEHLEMFDRQPFEPAGRSERSQKVRLLAPNGRNAHAPHLVLGQQAVGNELGQRVDQRAEQRTVAELALLVQAHGQHHELPARTQFAAAERDEFVPVARCLLRVRHPHVFVAL